MKNQKESKRITISVQIEQLLHRKLLREANLQGLSKSDIIRILLERGLNDSKYDK